MLGGKSRPERGIVCRTDRPPARKFKQQSSFLIAPSFFDPPSVIKAHLPAKVLQIFVVSPSRRNKKQFIGHPELIDL